MFEIVSCGNVEDDGGFFCFRLECELARWGQVEVV